MQAGSARSVGPSGRRLRQGLLALESAMAAVLLVGAVLLAQNLVALLDVDSGDDPAHIIMADIRLPDPPRSLRGGGRGIRAERA